MDAAMPLPPTQEDLRAQALAVITRVLKGEPTLSTTLAALGDLTTVQLLLELEEAFAIPLDPYEVLPDGTVAHLLLLVQRRILVGPRLTRPPGEPGCTLYDLSAYRATLPHWRRRMLGPGVPPPIHLVEQAAAEEAGRANAPEPGEDRWPAVPDPAPDLAITEAGSLTVLPIRTRACHAHRPRPVLNLVLGILAVALSAAALLEATTWCLDQLARVGPGLSVTGA